MKKSGCQAAFLSRQTAGISRQDERPVVVVVAKVILSTLMSIKHKERTLEKSVNQSELVAMVAKRMGTTNVEAERTVRIIFKSMSKALVDGDRIDLRGFGNFTVRDYKPYAGRDPRNRSVVHVGEKKGPFFKMSGAFRGAFAKGGKAKRYKK